jgi:hypothetical protein
MGVLDTTYRALVPTLPSGLRAVAAELPHRLGLTRDPAGGFEDFIELPPNRDLVAFAADDASLPSDTLERYRAAYCHGVYHGLLTDRLADRQTPPALELLALRDALRQRWQRSLADATHAPPLAARTVQQALLDLSRGVAIEQKALAARSLSIAAYTESVRLKSRWISVAPVLLLQQSEAPQRAASFERSYALLILGLQCADDALDAAEDEAIHGTSFPSALGFPPGGLFRAAPKVLRLAAASARGGGFTRLAAWLLEHAARLEDRTIGGNHLQNELASAVIASGIADSIVWGDASHPAPPLTAWLVPETRAA